MTHTEGPWFVRDGWTGYGDDWYESSIYGPGNKPVGRGIHEGKLPREWIEDPTLHPDTRLILAAPDLLEALREQQAACRTEGDCRDYCPTDCTSKHYTCDYCGHDYDYGAELHDPECLLAHTDAAIAKATGA